MEFGKKLQQLRKDRALTQEELAQVLCVSRAAVSKWESGRGYPGIESLKDISDYFSVSIDDLLSGEKLLSLAEKENKSNIRGLCDWLFGLLDLFSFMLVVLPLYPNEAHGYVFSVNLIAYTQTSVFNRAVYWVLFGLLFAGGIAKILFTRIKLEKINPIVTAVSVAVNIFAVIFLALTRQVYAVVVAFFFADLQRNYNFALQRKDINLLKIRVLFVGTGVIACLLFFLAQWSVV